MERGLFGKQRGESSRIGGGNDDGIESTAEPLGECFRRGEGVFDTNLLVKHHADDQGEGIAREQGVSLGVTRDRKGGHTQKLPKTCGPRVGRTKTT